MFLLNRMGNGKDNISSEEHFENSKTRRGDVCYQNCSVLSKYLNYISWPCPFTIKISGKRTYIKPCLIRCTRTLMRMTKDEKGLAFFKGLLL
jgi:hypothetical protein